MKRFEVFFITACVILTTANNALAVAFPSPGTNALTKNEISKVGFPGTVADIPYEARKENLAAGYQPYKDAVAYSSINVETDEQAIERQMRTLMAQYEYDKMTMSDAAYCEKYFDEERCPNDRGREQEYIAAADNPNRITEAQQGNSVGTTVAAGNALANKIINMSTSSPSTLTRATPAKNDVVKADNHIHDGPCTPSAISDNFRNQILTTGKYERIDPAFEKAMVQIFRAEGDCGFHPNDPGGYTCYGYAQNYNKDINVRKLTRGGAEDRTYERFYKAKNIDRLPDSVRGDVLRGDFASGPGQGIKKLQRTLGMAETGKVDSKLIQAAENFSGDLHNAYWDTMQQFYVDITKRKPKRKVFLKGWMNAVKLFRENGCHVQPARPLTR